MRVLTDIEYSSLHSGALNSFASLSHRELVGEIYGLRRPCTEHKAQLLWLFVYALNTWDNKDGAENYLTESQMLSMLSKIQTYGL